jgi:hypothetical protein
VYDDPLPQDDLDDIRKRVEKRLNDRTELFQHLFWFAAVNILLWGIYISSSLDANHFGHPWPLYVTGFWGIGVVGNVFHYWNEHGPGRERREAEIQREIERERERLGYTKRKNHEIRLTEDGELDDDYYYDRN